MRGVVLTGRTARVARDTFEKFHWFPKGETTCVMLFFFVPAIWRLQWVITQVAPSSLSHLLWNKTKYRAQIFFFHVLNAEISLVRATCLHGSALSWDSQLCYCRGEYNRETTLKNRINLPALSSPSESSGPHTTIQNTRKHLVSLLATF